MYNLKLQNSYGLLESSLDGRGIITIRLSDMNIYKILGNYLNTFHNFRDILNRLTKEFLNYTNNKRNCQSVKQLNVK